MHLFLWRKGSPPTHLRYALKLEFPKAFLDRLGAPIDSGNPLNWLTHLLFLWHVPPHPVHLMLLSYSLGCSLRTLVGTQLPSEPVAWVGLGPWPCLNQACSCYGQTVMRNVGVFKRRAGVVGRFVCPVCGSTYEQTASNDGAPRIISRGAGWVERLRRLREEGCSLREISESLGVSRPVVSKENWGCGPFLGLG